MGGFALQARRSAHPLHMDPGGGFESRAPGSGTSVLEIAGEVAEIFPIEPGHDAVLLSHEVVPPETDRIVKQPAPADLARPDVYIVPAAIGGREDDVSGSPRGRDHGHARQ